MRKPLLEVPELFLERLHLGQVGGESCFGTGVHIVSSSRRPLHVVDVHVGAACGLCLLADQLHILRDLGPALKVRDRTPVRGHHLEHLAKLELPNLLPGIDQRHRAVEAARVEQLVEDLAHCLPPPEATYTCESAQTFLPNSSVAASSSAGANNPALTRLMSTYSGMNLGRLSSR